MPWFKCFIAGHNFPGVLIEQEKPVGFYTTLFAEAPSPDKAEEEVLKILRKDKRLTLPEGSLRPVDARAFIEEIIEVSAKEVPASHSEGFAWYVSDDDLHCRE